MPESGFKIAHGYVEVTAEIDKNQVRAAAAKAGQDSGDHFSKSMAKTIKRDLDKEFGRLDVRSSLLKGMGRPVDLNVAGRRASRSFMDGITDGILKPSPAVVTALRTGIPAVLGSPFGLAAAGVAAVFVASFVGAVISSGISLLLGGLFVGLGALAVRENETVRAAFMRTVRRVDSAFTESAEGLVQPFADAAENAGNAFVSSIRPKLTTIFDGVAPGVEPLIDNLVSAVDRMLGVIAPGMASFTREFLIPASEQFPRLGEAAGHFFATIMRNGPLVSDAFEDIVDVTILLLDTLDDGTIILSRWWTWFNSIGDLVGPFAGAMSRASKETNGASNTLQDMEVLLSGPLYKAFLLYENVAKGGSRAIRDLTGETDGANVAARQFESATDLASAGMNRAAMEAGGLANAIVILNGGLLAGRASAREFEAAIDAAREALKENGKTLDINTEKGRDNQANLDAIADTAITWAGNIFEATKKTDGLSAAQKAANGILEDGRQAFIDAAVAAGMEEDAARELAEAIFAIPKSWGVDHRSNAKEQKRLADAYAAAIRNIPRSWDTTHFLNQVITQTSRRGVNASTVERYGGFHPARDGLISGGLGATAAVFKPGRRPLYMFAEPETGGEAFIARNAPRERSLDILSAAARWHRAVVVPMEKAATTMSASSPAPAPVSSGSRRPVVIPIYIGNEVIRVVHGVIDDRENELVGEINAGVGTAR